MISRSVHPAVLAAVRICLLLAFSMAAAHEAGAEELRVGSLRASPGQMVSGLIEVAHPGGGTSIPVTLICGAKPGKVLGLVAGVHGYEYPPILALERIRAMIDPARLSGSLVLLHIATPPAFQTRLLYYGP